jgi:transcriptional regulator with XRE-family HTH domain
MRRHIAKPVMSPQESWEYVKAAAERVGMTPNALAEKSGISRTLVGAWRRGEKGMGKKAKGLIDAACREVPEDRLIAITLVTSRWDRSLFTGRQSAEPAAAPAV